MFFRSSNEWARPGLEVLALSASAIAAMTGCIDGMDGSAESAGEKTATTEQAVVYGVDNRQDVALHPDPSLRTIAMNAVATTFAAPIDQPGAYEIRAGCFGAGTCSGTVGFVHQ